MENLMREWGCSDSVIKIFQEQEISLELLKDLNDHDLKDLIPTLGMRKLISKKIKEMNSENVDNNSEDTEDISCSSSSIASSISTNDWNLDMSEMFKTQFNDFDLSTLLQTSPMGASILKYYETNGILDNTRKNRLVDIIIKHLYTYIIKHRLRNEEYNKLGAKIVSLFPNELMGTYFVPPIKKRDSLNGKCVLARGKLVDKVKNLIYKCGEAEPKRKRRKTENGGKEANEVILSDHDNTSSYEDNSDYIWLQINREPWDEVIRRWSNTYHLRQKNKKSITVHEIFEIWPVLKDLRSHMLINSDFNRMFSDKEVRLFSKWQPFYEEFLQLSERNIKDSSSADILANAKAENEDVRFIHQLISLPFLIPPKGRLIQNKTHWKFSIQEVIQGFLVHAKSSGDKDSIIQEQRQKAIQRKQTVQPYLLVLGQSLLEPKSFYIVVDSLYHQFSSARKAFDILFKLFHVLDVNYPVQCQYLYVIIQRCVYNIVTYSDVIPPHIFEFVTKLKQN